MFEPTVIFQRTQAGRDEIYEKKRGLTQSERLVLIMIDGATPYQGVRAKLPVLTEERFQRALTTLQKKDLILEVFLPLEGQQPEEMEQTVVDRFIQQDPNDPLTIISFDPEEDFGIFGPAISATAPARPAASILNPPPAAPFPELTEIAPPAFSTAGSVMDEALIQQAEAVGEEVRAHRPRYENPIDQVHDYSVRRRPAAEREPAAPSATSTTTKLHWGYWMIGVGLAFIVGYAVARLSH